MCNKQFNLTKRIKADGEKTKTINTLSLWCCSRLSFNLHIGLNVCVRVKMEKNESVQVHLRQLSQKQRLSNCMYHFRNENFPKHTITTATMAAIISIQRTTNHQESSVLIVCWTRWQSDHHIMVEWMKRENASLRMYWDLHFNHPLIVSLQWSVSQSFKLNWNKLKAKQTDLHRSTRVVVYVCGGGVGSKKL